MIRFSFKHLLKFATLFIAILSISLNLSQANAQTTMPPKEEKRYNFTFNSMDIQTFVNVLNDVTEKDVHIETVPMRRPPFRINYKNVTWEEAVNLLAKDAKLVIQRNGNRMLLIPQEEYDPHFKQ